MADTKALWVAGENRDLPGFLRLPYELRQRIYRACLVEPAFWYRPHSPTCRFAAKDAFSTERPAFVKGTLVDNVVGDCSCSRRRGLVLLQVSRLVHREAAPVFWTGNTFCFVHAAGLDSSEFFDRVRPSHRLLIRHICVLPYIGDSLKRHATDYGYRPSMTRAFNHRRLGMSPHFELIASMWESLLACQGLHTLELHDGLLVEQLEKYASRMRANLPLLRQFRLVSLLAYKVWPAQEEIDELAAQKRSRNRLYNGPDSADEHSERDNDDDDDAGNNNNDNNNNNNDDDDDDDDGLDSNIGLNVPIPMAALGSMMPNNHIAHISTPSPPPPPPVRHLALNPIIPGSAYRMLYSFSRMLWFKVGVTIDSAVIDTFTRGTTPTSRLFPAAMDERVVKRTAQHYNRQADLAGLDLGTGSDSDSDSDSDSGADGDDGDDAPVDARTAQQMAHAEAARAAYKDMLRDFRTNFLVHMRHAIHKDLPFAWAAQQEWVVPLALRDADRLPPKKVTKEMRLKRGFIRTVDTDSPFFSCQKYGSVRRFMRRGAVAIERHYQYELPLYDVHDYKPGADGRNNDPMDDERGPLMYNATYGVKRYHADALRDVQKRIPRLATTCAEGIDKTIIRPALRDGKTYDVEMFGLPVTHDEHIRRVRQRLFYARNNEKTPEAREKEAADAAKEAENARFRVYDGARDRRQKLSERSNRLEAAKRDAADKTAALAKKTRRIRRRDEQSQRVQRHMERKRLPGVASLHAEHKKLQQKERAKQDEEQKKFEDEVEKKMKTMRLRMAKKKKPKRSKSKPKREQDYSDDEDHFESENSSSSSSESEDDEEEKTDESEDDLDLDLDEEEEDDDEDDDSERWPAPPKWTKPAKRAPRGMRYGGHAYKKCNRKPARRFQASKEDLDVYI